MMLLAFRFIAFKQLAGAYSEDVAEGVERRHVDTLWPSVSVHQANGGRDREGSLAGLHQRVGVAHSTLSHQVGQSHPHIEHDTSIATFPCSRKCAITLALVRKRYYIGNMENVA